MSKIFIGIFLSLFLSTAFTQIVPVRNANGSTYDYIDGVTKKIICKYAYDQASPFFEGMARVNRNGLFGFINSNGDEIIPCKYIHANDFSEGVASVSIGTQEITEYTISVKDEKYGVIDKTGKKIISYEFKDIANFKNGMARACDLTTRKWGWIDIKGNWNIRPKFQETKDFDDLGMAKIALNYDSTGYIDREGNYLIHPVYYEIGEFSDGLAPASIREGVFWKNGYINMKGETVIPFIYTFAGSFINGLATVCKDGKYGCIDKLGRVQIPLKYNYISLFNNGNAWVNDNGFWGVMNNQGQIILPINFDFLSLQVLLA